MSSINDYLSPLTEKEYNIKILLKRLFRTFPIMWHGIIPHKKVKSPIKKLPDFSFNSKDENLFVETAKEIYKESNERINNLEEKAFKLLSYISALSAVVLFFYSIIDRPFVKVLLIFSFFLLFVAIFLSLRCITVKKRSSVFLDDLFNFEKEEPTLRNKKEIITSFLDSAIYNQNVADNNADILKASRYFLTFVFIIAVACIPFILNSDLTDNKPKESILILKDTLLIEELKFNQTNILNQIDTISRINKQNTIKIDTILKKIKTKDFPNSNNHKDILQQNLSKLNDN